MSCRAVISDNGHAVDPGRFAVAKRPSLSAGARDDGTVLTRSQATDTIIRHSVQNASELAFAR